MRRCESLVCLPALGGASISARVPASVGYPTDSSPLLSVIFRPFEIHYDLNV
jgi:hypothetical protein